MPIDAIPVGSNQRTVVTLGDANSASKVASVLSVADSTSLAGLFAQVVQSAKMLLNASGTYDVARSAAGATGIPSVNTEGTRATYSSGAVSFTPVATATDFAAIVGSGTKTIRILRISISGFASAAISQEIQLIKRSTANTGSTPSDQTVVPNDSNDAAATGVFRLYTATNPTLGAGIGTVRAAKLNLGVTGAAGSITWDFTTRNDQAIVLRGTTQYLGLNWNGAAIPSGTSLCLDVEWSEE